MKKINKFNVLIVYNGKVAKSASSKTLKPFSIKSKYNEVYSYFLQICEKNNLQVAFSTSKDVVSAGTCSNYWTFQNNRWFKNNKFCYSTLIFDKLSPTNKSNKQKRKLLFSDLSIKPFNNPTLFKLFFDKQKIYKKLSNYTIPTISLNESTVEGIKNSCNRLSTLINTHKNSEDFSSQIVMKDRFGAGGHRVYKFKKGKHKKMLSVMKKNSMSQFVIQPFTKFKKGFSLDSELNIRTEIRLIYLKGKFVQSYIREAKNGEFRCNEHRGGLLTYISQNKIPQELLKKSKAISSQLGKTNSLFSLDFIISNNGNSYLLEGNTGPGLDWNTNIKKNEIEAKKLINLVVENLANRVKI